MAAAVAHTFSMDPCVVLDSSPEQWTIRVAAFRAVRQMLKAKGS